MEGSSAERMHWGCRESVRAMQCLKCMGVVCASARTLLVQRGPYHCLGLALTRLQRSQEESEFYFCVQAILP